MFTLLRFLPIILVATNFAFDAGPFTNLDIYDDYALTDYETNPLPASMEPNAIWSFATFKIRWKLDSTLLQNFANTSDIENFWFFVYDSKYQGLNVHKYPIHREDLAVAGTMGGRNKYSDRKKRRVPVRYTSKAQFRDDDIGTLCLMPKCSQLPMFTIEKPDCTFVVNLTELMANDSIKIIGASPPDLLISAKIEMLDPHGVPYEEFTKIIIDPIREIVVDFDQKKKLVMPTLVDYTLMRNEMKALQAYFHEIHQIVPHFDYDQDNMTIPEHDFSWFQYYAYIDQYYNRRSIISNKQLEKYAARIRKHFYSSKLKFELRIEKQSLAVLDLSMDWVNQVMYVSGVEHYSMTDLPRSVIYSTSSHSPTTKLYTASENYFVVQIQVDPYANVLYFTEYSMVDKTNTIKKIFFTGDETTANTTSFFSHSSKCTTCKPYSKLSISPVIGLSVANHINVIDGRQSMEYFGHTKNGFLPTDYNVLFATDSQIIESDPLGCNCRSYYDHIFPDKNNFWKVSNDVQGNVFWINGTKSDRRLFSNITGMSREITEVEHGNRTIKLLAIYDMQMFGGRYRSIPEATSDCKKAREFDVGGKPNISRRSSTTAQVCQPSEQLYQGCTTRSPLEYTVFYKKINGKQDKDCCLVNSKLCETKTMMYRNCIEIIDLESDSWYAISIERMGTYGRFMSDTIRFNTEPDPLLLENKNLRVKFQLTVVTVLLLILIGCLLILGFMFYKILKKWMNERKFKSIIEAISKKQKPAGLKFYSYDKVTFDFDAKGENVSLGRGCFGEVLRGSLSTNNSHKRVAIKQLYSRDNYELQVSFFREALITARLSNNCEGRTTSEIKHIVQLFGVVINCDVPLLLLELVENGITLQTFFEQSQFQNYDHKNILMVLSFIGQIAKGLQFIHEKEIIHKDLKLNNILCEMTKDQNSVRCLKIADFGIAKMYEEESISTTAAYDNVACSFKYALLPYPTQYSDAYDCDIWLFGYLIWSILHDDKRLTNQQNWIDQLARPVGQSVKSISDIGIAIAFKEQMIPMESRHDSSSSIAVARLKTLMERCCTLGLAKIENIGDVVCEVNILINDELTRRVLSKDYMAHFEELANGFVTSSVDKRQTFTGIYESKYRQDKETELNLNSTGSRNAKINSQISTGDDKAESDGCNLELKTYPCQVVPIMHGGTYIDGKADLRISNKRNEDMVLLIQN